MSQADLVGIRQDLKRLSTAAIKTVPFAEWEFVSVTFGDAHTDTEIRHHLRPKDPGTVRYLVVDWGFPSRPLEAPVLYRDRSAQAKPWVAGIINLRCSVGGAQARILLCSEVIS